MLHKNKQIEKEHSLQYYLANRERIKKRDREYYLKNRDKCTARVRKRYWAKRDLIRLQKKKWYEANKEKVSITNKKWVLNNPDKVRAIKKRYRLTNKEKLKIYDKKYRLANKLHYNLIKRIWRKNNPDKMRNEKLMGRFKITLKDYNILLDGQNNKCGICDENFDFKNPNGLKYPCIDHDHSTKNIRGLLCRRCNSGIGGFKDSIEILKQALLWIKGDIQKNINNKNINIDIPLRKIYAKKKEYGITENDYKNILISQNNKCGICKLDLNIPIKKTGQAYTNIDHDHASGKIRGILCPKCNRALGLLKDNSDIIKNAIKWLEKI